ncbi:ferric iron uptake transcriptional regulator [soil metagenome]
MPTAVSNIDRQVERRLFEHRVRYTNGRRVVVEALGLEPGPRSAADLHDRIGPRVPLSSLYRTLAVLEEAGVVALHHSSKGLTRYELAEWLRGHHHHLLCTSCGAVEDTEIPESVETDLRDIVRRIGSRSKFKPSDHALEIEGLCVKCT